MQNKVRVGSILALAALLVAGCDGNSASAPYAGSPEPTSSDGYGGYVPPVEPAAAAGSAAVQAGSGAVTGAPNVVLASGGASAAYMTDGSGRALYMFANDVPGTNNSTCTAACLDKWPVFDAKQISVGAGLTASDFNRFQRADGAWQTTFKGHPLYRFATDAAGSVSGDGAAGRWYVARDYLAFLLAKTDVTPQGASMPAPFMTNRAGRTVYVFMNDTAGAAGKPATSACVDKCLDAWPVWSAPATPGTMVVPSSMNAADFGQLERTVAGAAVKQLTYRGYPLYFHTPDVDPGATSGHMSGAWRAIDPATFPAAAAATSK
jgi:predicted lipoprotein with Yx(FWY)xxD motif